MKKVLLNTREYALIDFATVSAAKKAAKENNGQLVIIGYFEENFEGSYEIVCTTEKGIADDGDCDCIDMFDEDIEEWQSKEEFMNEMNSDVYSAEFLEKMWQMMEKHGQIKHTSSDVWPMKYIAKRNNHFVGVKLQA